LLKEFNNCAPKTLTSLGVRSFANIFSKRKPDRKDLDKYGVITIGCNLGGMWSRHFDAVDHGHHSMLCVLDESVN